MDALLLQNDNLQMNAPQILQEDQTERQTISATAQDQQSLQEQTAAQRVIQAMPTQARITNTAPAGNVNRNRTESRSERKKREEREKAVSKAIRQQANVVDTEWELENVRLGYVQDEKLNGAAGEKKLLDERLKEIEAAKSARQVMAKQGVEEPEEIRSKFSMDDDNNGISVKDREKRRELRIEWEVCQEKIEALDRYAKSLPVGSAERVKILEQKEKLIVKGGELKRERSILAMEGEERARETRTMTRHARFDFLKGIFRKENPLSHEDATCRNPENDAVLTNVGRQTMGGTKPMYLFKDASGKEYLYKEAINCIGFDKPEGALVTEAASKLQRFICGEFSIPAFAVKVDGKVVGSMQEKVTSYKGPGQVDLFKWQAERQTNPQMNADNTQGQQLSNSIKGAILREHVLDWLLCNFDTKGENFLQRASDQQLCSFDKEASFSKLNDEGAQHMSTTYKPHSNDTIYNTIFQDFANGMIDLNLQEVYEHVQHVESLDNNEYLAMFSDMLTQKYGEGTAERQEAERKILARKDNLKGEYERFFGELIKARKAAIENMRNSNDATVAQQARAMDTHEDWVEEQQGGALKFIFRQENPIWE